MEPITSMRQMLAQCICAQCAIVSFTGPVDSHPKRGTRVCYSFTSSMVSTTNPTLSKNGLNGCNDLGDIKVCKLTENLFHYWYAKPSGSLHSPEGGTRKSQEV